METLLTQQGLFEKKCSRVWGTYWSLTKKDLPESPPEMVLNNDLPQVPKELWERIIRLFEDHVSSSKKADSTSEVNVVFLLSKDLKSWRAVVPRQEVGGAHVTVTSFDDAVDIETGEAIEYFPPEGWLHAGDVHQCGCTLN